MIRHLHLRTLMMKWKTREINEWVIHEDSSKNKDGRRELQLVKYTEFSFEDRQKIRSMKEILFELEFNKKALFEFSKKLLVVYWKIVRKLCYARRYDI